MLIDEIDRADGEQREEFGLAATRGEFYGTGWRVRGGGASGPISSDFMTGYSGGGGFGGGISSLVFGLCRSPLAFPFAHEPAYSGHSAGKIVRLCGLQ